MSKINDLIKKLCPYGVEYKKICDVCNVVGRIGFRGYKREDQVEKGNGAISLSPSNIINGKINYNECTYISWDKYNESPEIMVNEGDVIFCKTASVGKTCYIENMPEKTTINPQLILLKNISINSKYLSYCLKTKDFQIKANSIKGLGTIPTLSQKDFNELTVPVPPLEVQEEIVRILDKFGKLEAELEAELEARKSQYEFWRGKLLNMDYKKIKLLNLCDKVNNINWKNDNNNYKYIDLSSVNRENNQVVETSNISKENAPSRARQIVKTKDVLFGTTRPMLKRITLISQEYDNQICSTGYCVLRPNREKVVPEWLYFNLQTEDFYKYVENFQQGASYPSISDNAVKNYEISLPPSDVQIKVINVLTKFDKLTNDISEGLPVEIELRRKQYEYYRNKLLNFKELKNE